MPSTKPARVREASVSAICQRRYRPAVSGLSRYHKSSGGRRSLPGCRPAHRSIVTPASLCGLLTGAVWAVDSKQPHAHNHAFYVRAFEEKKSPPPELVVGFFTLVNDFEIGVPLMCISEIVSRMYADWGHPQSAPTAVWQVSWLARAASHSLRDLGITHVIGEGYVPNVLDLDYSFHWLDLGNFTNSPSLSS